MGRASQAYDQIWISAGASLASLLTASRARATASVTRVCSPASSSGFVIRPSLLTKTD